MKYRIIALLLAVGVSTGCSSIRAQAAPPDVQGSGYLTPADLFEFAGQWQDETDFSRFDWDGDRRLRAPDLLEGLERWSSRNDVLTLSIPDLEEGARAMRLVRIPAGSFSMGSAADERNREASEGPRREVHIGYDFYMGETEVTQAQWRALMKTAPAQGWGTGPDHPVYSVSFWEIAEPSGFLARLRAETRIAGLRLPSESEWEYACRGGSNTRFFFGDFAPGDFEEPSGARGVGEMGGRMEDYMWYCGNKEWGGYPAGCKPVGRLAANRFGLFDIHGNVWEWLLDDWHNDYTGAPTDGSPWYSSSNRYRVCRGGSWDCGAEDNRSATRNRELPHKRTPTLGFRVVLPVE